MDGVWIDHTNILLRSIWVGQSVLVEIRADLIRVAGMQGVVLPFLSPPLPRHGAF